MLSIKFFEEENFTLYKGDSLEILDSLDADSIDVIFADPPYFLSNGGVTVKSGRFVNVDKGDWDKPTGKEETNLFNKMWIEKCFRILKPGGTIWISGTHHNIFDVGAILTTQDFKIINTITWYKPNASPNLSCKYFTHSTELVIWARKGQDTKHTFNYAEMKEENNGKQMRDVWEIPVTPKREKLNGHHPTQKPLTLLDRIVRSSTNPGDIILDPFNGSGTTGIAAALNNRKYIGIEMEEEFLELTKKRYLSEANQISLEL